MYTFDFNKLVGNIILVFGYLVFLFNLTYVTPFHTYNTVTNFYLTVIILCITIFCWIIWHLASRSFIIHRFLWVLTVSGVLLSFSILFIFGVEPIGTRHGVGLFFHPLGVAFFLLGLFLSIIPQFLRGQIYKIKNAAQHDFTNQASQPARIIPDKTAYVSEHEDWDIASEDEIKSGKYFID